MKLVHFESGLGNQMLNYAEYLAMKYANPNDECIIENIIYEYPDVNNVICQWNGFELTRIFGLDIPNIRDKFNDDEWQEIIREIGKTKFWRNEWNYPEAILSVLSEHGYIFENECVPFKTRSKKEELLRYLKNANPISAKLKFEIKKRNEEKYKYERAIPDRLFMTTDRSIYVGQTLGFLFCGNDIEEIEEQLRADFTFPKLSNDKDKRTAEIITTCNSISIHARRGDDLSNQSMYYKSGYFKRAMKYIKKNIEHPVFFIFGDSGATQWCQDNLPVFSLSPKDEVFFVDWNKGLDSFRDMQLMSMCKHNVFTDSSFGWWAAFLNANRNKITASSNFAMNTTHHF